jgi:NADP-dependent 3-hydroxy acid dehydrogenase YdfG
MARSVLITGATGGIGGAVARAAGERGYRVLAAGRDPVRLDRYCEEFRGSVPVLLDLRDPDRLATSLPALDRLDALVHCAGVAEVAGVEETAHTVWLETLTVNVVAAAEITRALLPALRRAAGHIVFINAAPRLHAVPRWSAYVASKTALRELADSLRAEEARNGLRVTTVYPGGTSTDLLAKVRDRFGQPYRAADCIQPTTLASVVLTILDMRNDAYLPEVSVLPTPRT